MASAASSFHCSICSESFLQKKSLQQHMEGHPDAAPVQNLCKVCNWLFPDSLALESHRIQTGHGTSPEFKCDNCSAAFATPRSYKRHRAFPSPCSDAFRTKKPTAKTDATPANAPRNRTSGYVDLDIAQDAPSVLPYDSPSEISSTKSNSGKVYCPACRKYYESEFQFNRHCLRCTSQAPSGSGLHNRERARSQNGPTNPTALSAFPAQPAVLAPQPARRIESAPPATTSILQQHAALQQAVPVPANKAILVQTTQATPPPTTASIGFACSSKGCRMSFRSEAALKTHRADAHGIGGNGLDLHGKDSWMLNQRVREQLKNEGLLRPPSGPTRSSSPSFGRGSARSRGQVSRGALSSRPAQSAPPQELVPARDQADIEQAYDMNGKMMRLVLQSDIAIHHTGNVKCNGVQWTRVGFAKQPDVSGMFDKLCHLPAILQGEYLPPPKTFKDDYVANYPVVDFEPSPDRNAVQPALKVIALSCSKIALANGRLEAVKLAAVDVVSCRILLSHLICTDPSEQVKDWRTATTGLDGYHNLEDARQAGYKVFKGWKAARAALWKFIDKQTIIVGHNLRSDLDALRMIHGRAVDIIKCVEKVAKGLLSKEQLRLDSLCRDLPKVRLSAHPSFGRDCLQDAFAARELGLWIVKHEGDFTKYAKQKSLEYQRVLSIGRT